MNKKKILVFIDWYLPGYKAGGPIQSCANIISHLKDQYDFSVVTSDTDYTDHTPYRNVKSNEWNVLGDTPVFYCSGSFVDRVKYIRSIIKNDTYDVIYFNSFFSIFFTILPLVLLWLNKRNAKVILAPRGMLANGALSIKPFKKFFFIKVFTRFGIFKKVIFHASSEAEASDVKRVLGENITIRTALNLLSTTVFSELKKRDKEPGKIRMVYVSRIAPEKNLKYALNFLSKVKIDVVFDVYGPIYNDKYWNECQELINQLPQSIKVEYKSFLKKEDVSRILQGYHVLLLPTLGENFGHIILESLSAGCLVLISDRTPWRNLEKLEIGADISLEQEYRYIDFIHSLSALSQDEFDLRSLKARAFALSYNNDNGIIDQNRKLFSFEEDAILQTEQNRKNKILIFVDWYKPGYKAGGPIQSVTNIISHFRDEFDFSVITTDTDYKEITPYTNIISNAWNILPSGTRVYYISKSNISFSAIKNRILEEDFDTIYLNSFFSYYFTILPLIITKVYKRQKKIILAPRGMLSKAALSLKFFKKSFYLMLAKTTNLYKGIIWHASTDKETLEIKSILGKGVNVITALNLSISMNVNLNERKKEAGQLNLIYLSRITRKKQLLNAVGYLLKTDKNIHVNFEIYGPVGEPDYWNQIKKVITLLPENITVVYKGAIRHYEVESAFLNNHFLLFPTLNENFGHAIMESLSAGCPVIISDKTPWVNLEEKRVGWDIDLSDEKKFVDVLNKCGAMDQEEYNVWSENAGLYARQIKNDKNVIDQNRLLFSKEK